MPPNHAGDVAEAAGSRNESLNLCAGLDILTKAYQCAGELGRSAWDFAVELATLRAAGLTETNLRWLVCKRLCRACPWKGGRWTSDGRSVCQGRSALVQRPEPAWC